MTDDRGFLGTGVAFPVGTDGGGRLATATGTEDVEQAIRIVLGTAKGERVMRPDFGCGIHDYAFAVVDATTRTRVEASVREALARWEPRIVVEDVTASTAEAGEGRLLVEIDYRVRATNAPGNLVYPFYLGED
ncbi:MAG: GPW/gp25 family protein [Haloarculaceae archaeon]